MPEKQGSKNRSRGPWKNFLPGGDDVRNLKFPWLVALSLRLVAYVFNSLLTRLQSLLQIANAARHGQLFSVREKEDILPFSHRL